MLTLGSVRTQFYPSPTRKNPSQPSVRVSQVRSNFCSALAPPDGKRLQSLVLARQVLKAACRPKHTRAMFPPSLLRNRRFARIAAFYLCLAMRFSRTCECSDHVLGVRRPLGHTKHDKFYQLLWRPRPPSLLSETQEKLIRKDLRGYSKKYEEEDTKLKLSMKGDMLLQRKQQHAEFETFLHRMNDAYKAQKQARDSSARTKGPPSAHAHTHRTCSHPERPGAA